jgi:hypothetical protein
MANIPQGHAIPPAVTLQPQLLPIPKRTQHHHISRTPSRRCRVVIEYDSWLDLNAECGNWAKIVSFITDVRCKVSFVESGTSHEKD